MVSIPSIPSDISQHLLDLNVSSVAIAPTHCGLLSPSGSIELKVDHLVNSMAKSEVSFHSIQGILFGIDPDASNLAIKVANRFNSVLEIANLLNVKNVVLGAPNFRRSFASWGTVLEVAQTLFVGNNLAVHIENICVDKLQGGHHPFGPDERSLKAFHRVLDISNAFECSMHTQDLISGDFWYPIIHASGKNHKSLKASDESKRISQILINNFSKSDIVWELDYQDSTLLFGSLRESLTYLQNCR